MNLYNQHPQYREPTVPPRRKRSLSTSRFDSNERSYYGNDYFFLKKKLKIQCYFAIFLPSF